MRYSKGMPASTHPEGSKRTVVRRRGRRKVANSLVRLTPWQ